MGFITELIMIIIIVVVVYFLLLILTGSLGTWWGMMNPPKAYIYNTSPACINSTTGLPTNLAITPGKCGNPQ